MLFVAIHKLSTPGDRRWKGGDMYNFIGKFSNDMLWFAGLTALQVK